MKITEMRVTPIAIVDPPLLNAAGLHAPYALRTIVELVTDSNVTGVGEVTGSVAITEALEAARDVVVGMDPFNLSKLRLDLKARFGGARKEGDRPWDKQLYIYALSATEVACYDIIGKETGRPVCDLIGGKVRERVQFSAYLFYKHKGAGGERGFDVHPHAAGWQAGREAAALDPAGV
ncbi:MAG TPA: glucarate dehydratase, partial [Spirochaetia bacterium]|nr:glucarate dehydratase [Spirochaetia bacterium]